MNAHAALRAGDEVRHPRAWLYRITRNAALNVLRAAHDELPFNQAEVPDPRDGPAAAFELTERLQATLEAVRDLPERQRSALLLRELQGRSHEEIGDALGVTAGAARQHLMRARATVRAAITAVTPYPLLSRLMDLGASAPSSAPVWLEGATGAAAGLTLTKVAVGVVATSAIVGGTVGGRQLVTPAPHEARAAGPAAQGPVTSPPAVAPRATARVRLPASVGTAQAVAVGFGLQRLAPVADPQPATANHDLPVASVPPAAVTAPQADLTPVDAPVLEVPTATGEPPAVTPDPAPAATPAPSSSDATGRVTPPPPAAPDPDPAATATAPDPASSPPATTAPGDPASSTVPPTAATPAPGTELPDPAAPQAQANLPVGGVPPDDAACSVACKGT